MSLLVSDDFKSPADVKTAPEITEQIVRKAVPCCASQSSRRKQKYGKCLLKCILDQVGNRSS